MRIAVEQIGADGLHLAGTLAAPSDPSWAEEIQLPAPIAFSVKLAREGQRVSVGGWLHTTAHVSCSRCLVPTPCNVDREFEIGTLPAEGEPTEEVTELDAQDLDIDYYAEDSLDLRALLVEQVLLDLPMKLLCSENCRGLCPQCGADRNRQSCDCEEPGDPRLSPLAELRDRL